jgi:hypothetical protein
VTHLLSSLVVLSLIYSSCALKEPDPAPQPVLTKRQVTNPISPPLPKENRDGELENELRNPNVLEKLDAEYEKPSTETSPPTRISKPLVIKGSELPPEIPIPNAETPKPPLTKPPIPEE